ncbi:MAG TPA: amidohydrolase family protein, partial [Pyrinomonadaceae bacterium]|nr:amidohydrolase family protein [Pyrinomonadaceae bacterium]
LYRDRKIDTLTIDQNYAFFGTMTRDRPYYDRSLRTLSKNKTCVVTNAVQTATFSGDFEMADKSRLRFKTPSEREKVAAAIVERERQIRNDDYRTSPQNRKRALQDIWEIHRAGVMLLAGTQLNQGEIGTPGLILHDELSIFVQAGLSPFEALQTATINPARFMRRDKDLGTIEVGKIADILVLDADPLADISNTRKIKAVIVGGRVLNRQHLDKMLAEVQANANLAKRN